METLATWPASNASQFDRPTRLDQAISRFVPMSVVNTARAESRDSLQLTLLDDIILADLSWGPGTASRRDGDTAVDQNDYCVLLAARSGREHITVGSNTYELRPGDVALWNCQVPTTVQMDGYSQKNAMIIPTKLLDQMSIGSRGRKDYEVFNEVPVTALFRQTLTYLTTNSGKAAMIDRRIRNSLLELAVGTIESSCDADGTALLPTLRSAVCSWIDHHLFDPDLDPQTVAAAHSVSVRTLHRAFRSGDQTLTQVIRSRRLARARDLLSHPQESVTSVSAKLHFANPSHLSRLFTQEFGMPPSEYRAGLMKAQQPGSAALDRPASGTPGPDLWNSGFHHTVVA